MRSLARHATGRTTDNTARGRVGALLLVTALAASPALAQEEPAPAEVSEAESQLVRPENRAPREGTPLISNKLYPMQFRLEFTGMFDMTYGNKYTQHYGGHGAFTFHVFDWLAVEAYAGYLAGDETNIAARVREVGKHAILLEDGSADQCATPLCEPELPDLWQTTWIAGANVQWAPIYGKLSVVSELDLSFQLFGLLGGGVEGIRKRLNDDSYDTTTAAFRPVVTYGIGLRLIPWKWIALRAELRNHTGINPNVPEFGSGADVCKEGYTMQVSGQTECLTDFSNNAMLQLGMSFLF